MLKLKEIPKFKSEEEEVIFWDTHDTSEYYDLTKMERVIFPNLKRSVKTISIRLPESMINSLKYLSNCLDVPYQSLIKQYLQENINKQLKIHSAPQRAFATRSAPKKLAKKQEQVTK